VKLNDFSRFGELKATIDEQWTKNCFNGISADSHPTKMVIIKASSLLRMVTLECIFEPDGSYDSAYCV